MSLRLLPLALLFTAACVGEQAYTPISTDQSDEICKQGSGVAGGELELSSTGSVGLELDEDGVAYYESTLEVTDFSASDMRVAGEEIIVSIPANRTATFHVEEGDWELFTNMVFKLDVRHAGESEWQDMVLDFSLYDIDWFTEVEFSSELQLSSVSTIRRCSTVEIGGENIELAFDLSEDYEVRMRAFPFEGLGDLVGEYDYAVSVSVR